MNYHIKISVKNIFRENFFEHILSLNKIYCSKDSPVDIKAFIMLNRNYEDLLLVRRQTYNCFRSWKEIWRPFIRHTYNCFRSWKEIWRPVIRQTYNCFRSQLLHSIISWMPVAVRSIISFFRIWLFKETLFWGTVLLFWGPCTFVGGTTTH